MTDEQCDNEMRWWNERADTLDGLRNPRQPTGEVNPNGAPVYQRLPEHEVEEQAYQFALNTLGEKCDFLRNAYPYLFVRDENLLVPMAEDSKALQLLGRLRLRARQKHTGLVLSNLKLHIDQRGVDVEMGHWGLLKGDALYLNDGRGGIIKITSRRTEDDLPNGFDGVYMDDPRVKPWPRLDENGNIARLKEIERMLGGKGLLVTDTPLCAISGACMSTGRSTRRNTRNCSWRGTWPCICVARHRSCPSSFQWASRDRARAPWRRKYCGSWKATARRRKRCRRT